MVLVEGVREAGADVLVVCASGAEAEAGDGDLGTGEVFVLEGGGLAMEGAAAKSEAEAFGDDGAGEVEVALRGIAVVGVGLEGAADGGGAGPALADFAGDDVDDAAHGIGAVEGGHGAADDFDAFDGGDGRHEAGGGFAKAVGGDAAGGVLAAAVDEHEGVVAGHAADADGETTGLADVLADIDAFDVDEGLCKIGDPAFAKLLLLDHGDAGGGIADDLLEAAGGDRDGVGDAGEVELEVLLEGFAGGDADFESDGGEAVLADAETAGAGCNPKAVAAFAVGDGFGAFAGALGDDDSAGDTRGGGVEHEAGDLTGAGLGGGGQSQNGQGQG